MIPTFIPTQAQLPEPELLSVPISYLMPYSERNVTRGWRTTGKPATRSTTGQAGASPRTYREESLLLLAHPVVVLASMAWTAQSGNGGPFSSFHPIGRNRLVHAERLCQASKDEKRDDLEWTKTLGNARVPWDEIMEEKAQALRAR